tara:strand:+ start:151 stop:300 length:150 start_codon:yes stop_codon:yes gene_type:complete
MQPKKEKRLMVHVYLTYEEKKRIEEEEAKRLGISVSSYIKIKLFMKDDR